MKTSMSFESCSSVRGGFVRKPGAVVTDTHVDNFRRNNALFHECQTFGFDPVYDNARNEIMETLDTSLAARHFFFVHRPVKDEAGNNTVIHQVYETSRTGEVTAVTWRDSLRGLGCNAGDYIQAQFDSPLEHLSDKHNIPVIDPRNPVFPMEESLPKAWGAEITYTMIEKRMVNSVADMLGRVSKLPDVLRLFPSSFGVDPAKDLVLLKILKPGSRPIDDDLYLELHWEKREVYVVTDIDSTAWPTGRAEVVCGLNPELIASHKSVSEGDWENRYKDAFKTAVGRMNRSAIYQFAGKIEVGIGDVLVFNNGTVHSLRHGVEVAEILTPHYERAIFCPTPQPVTSFGGEWFTDKGFEHLVMSPYEEPVFGVLADSEGIKAEELALFPISDRHFSSQRIRILQGHTFSDTTAPGLGKRSYHLLMAVQGPMNIASSNGWKYDLQPKKAVLIPQSNGPYEVSPEDGNEATYLKMALVGQ